MKQYKAKNGAMQYKPSTSWLLGAERDNLGWCLACGTDQGGVEPDARKYRCEGCGAHKVYGHEELALMGLCYIDQGAPDNRASRDYGDVSPRE